MKVLFIGDIMGCPGRNAVGAFIKKLKQEKGPFDFIIAESENAAGGFGLTEKVANDLFSYGIDILTNGNHIWDKKDFVPLLDELPNVLRAANYPAGAPGRGFAVFEKNGKRLAVLCLQGRTFMPPIDCPFQTADRILDGCDEKCVFVDFHAEATSEKKALALYLDGKISAFCGTHTHVQTADEQVLPKGTAFLTDVGMTGGHAGLIGMTAESVMPKFLLGLPTKFDVCEKNVKFQAAIIEIDEQTGKALQIERVSSIVE
ncbi:MAG: TIGR00282 family metallophosphoesterase [Synergistaceae bacterium]|nr:TIGR00282 family metallophosphoesterase [Synergistaceae bacterium]